MRAVDLRRSARQSLRGNWFIAFIASVIASLLGAGGSYSVSVSVPSEELDAIVSQMDAAQLQVVISTLAMFATFSAMIGIAMFIIGSAVGIGYAQFNLDIVDGSDASIGTLFSKFGQLKTAIFARIFVAIRVFFATLLFIIPGIIASFNYVILFHVMADNPDMNAFEVVRECKRIMKGNRWRYFCLSLSFIPHLLLSMLTFGIALIWVIPHIQATVAAFYREIA